MSFVALLRAINVGKRQIKMDALRGMFEDMGYSNVRSYIQSGNVVFDTRARNTDKMAARISEHIESEVGFDVAVMVRTGEEIASIVEHNPFKHVELSKDIILYVSFLSEEPSVAAAAAFVDASTEYEKYVVDGPEAYILRDRRNKESPFSNNYLEKMLGVRATNRNWNTVNKLIGMSKAK
ncbi:MAG: DUF1697 domain-containing protein [Chloroflexi bacterium]|nr:MAG: DUF1697 domain-containing protein [Chloroflexota bacterium]MBL1195655.1 DUF1697 domain-containing protein [Chloroflexota bacterium]NOH12943.1 DUF1697 domain-containing protein [Chloroflexota bacterium]